MTKVLSAALIFSILLIPLEALATEGDVSSYLALGKMALDKGDAEAAAQYLTLSIEKLPLLADYALYWRALAYERLKDTDGALKDLRKVIEVHKGSPLIRQARSREVEILKRTDHDDYLRAVEAYIKDYSSDYATILSHAQYLYQRGDQSKAKRLFKEVFINTTNTLATKALKALGEDALTAEDLLKKANNLNKQWLFSEAERYFKEAQKKDKRGQLRSAIREGLAYSYFRQKRYKEASELYKERRDLYWYSRSLLRAREIATFEENLKRLKDSDDKRILPLLISYGNIKRRAGAVDEALTLFNELLKRHTDKKGQEPVLWAIAWIHYLQRDYERAVTVLTRLSDQYGDARYSYWLKKAQAHLDNPEKTKTLSIGYRDYYGYLTALKEGLPIKSIGSAYNLQNVPNKLQRAEVLFTIGLKEEAVTEAVYSVRVSGDALQSAAASAFLHRVGNHQYAVNIISKTPYREEYHPLLYPFVFMDEIQEAARQTGLDPLLILSVIREESRYHPEARSIAGALGLMQLMPTTARLYERHAKVSVNSNSDLFEPKRNILIGSHYLKHLINLFGSLPPAIAAYNAGEEVVKEWLKKGNYKGIDEFIEDIPYEETNNYVKKVLTTYFEYLRTKDTPMPDPKAIGIL